MLNLISSLQNPKIQQVRKLHDAKARVAQQLFIAEGLRTVSTLLAAAGSNPNHSPRPSSATDTLLTSKHISDGGLTQLFITPAQWDLAPMALKSLPAKLVTLVSDQVSAKISTSSTSSGILALFKIPQYTQLNLTPGIILVDLRDPGNLGTLIRTAAALNLKTVVTIAGTDPWGPRVIQASAGTIGQVQLYQLSWSELLALKQNLKLCALVPHAPINLLEPTSRAIIQNSLLVVGNEAYGIPAEYLADCDYQFSLPMPGQTESLNAAIAGSIAMYLATQS